MSKKQTPAPSTAPYNVVSLPSQPLKPEEEQAVRNVISEAAPRVRPSTIVVLPHDQYRDIANQVARGRFGDTRLGNAAGSEEDNSQQSNFQTGIRNGFSMVKLGRMYIDRNILNNQNDLRETLTHELGHFQVDGGTEEQADDAKVDLNNRVKQAAKIDSGVAQLPVVAQIGDKVVAFHPDMSMDDIQAAAAKIHQDSNDATPSAQGGAQ